MSENLSIDGLYEQNVCIDDIHQISNAKLQVSEPRKPCVKISRIHNNSNFTHEIFKMGLSGWYYKVLQVEQIRKYENIKILEKNLLHLVYLNSINFFTPHIKFLRKIQI